MEVSDVDVPHPAAAAAAPRLSSIGELHVHNPAGLDGEGFARQFAHHYQIVASKQSRRKDLTYDTLTARGAR